MAPGGQQQLREAGDPPAEVGRKASLGRGSRHGNAARRKKGFAHPSGAGSASRASPAPDRCEAVRPAPSAASAQLRVMAAVKAERNFTFLPPAFLSTKRERKTTTPRECSDGSPHWPTGLLSRSACRESEYPFSDHLQERNATTPITPFAHVRREGKKRKGFKMAAQSGRGKQAKGAGQYLLVKCMEGRFTFCNFQKRKV